MRQPSAREIRPSLNRRIQPSGNRMKSSREAVLKMMREMGPHCGIRRETDYHRCNSYRGVVGETFENVLGRDFKADGPRQKMGTDVTEFKLSFGKAHLAPV